MSDDIKKFKTIVENAHRATAPQPLSEATKMKATKILESINVKGSTKDALFGAIINSDVVESKEEAIQVLSEMQAQLRARRR
jgi:hypothetical protein